MSLNGKKVRTTTINFSQKKIFPLTISKESLNNGKNELSFKLYTNEISDKHFGSDQKPYTLHKVIYNER